METKIQIKSIFGKLLFEYEKEGNTVKDTLQEADLRGANLRGADLRGANLREAENKDKAILPMFCKWSFGIKGDKIQIGCKEKTIEGWDNWFQSKEEYSTSRDTEDFKQIEAVYNGLKAYYLNLNK